jgi:isoleucyl-tRNA synthetase
VVDGEGRKMSKLLGNVINPQDVCDELGADILRLWVASADYTVDIPASEEIFDRLVEAYRRIRNTLRFLIGNLYDFDVGKDVLKPEDMEELDRWILSRLQELVRRSSQALDEYQLHTVYHALHNFCAVDLSSLYLDMRKDCLYTFAEDSRQRKSAQTALYYLLVTVVKLMAPIVAHTSEEAWQRLSGDEGKDSVHLQDWPSPDDTWEDAELNRIFKILLDVRDKVTKAIEDKRVQKEIGTSLEADVKVFIPPSIAAVIKERENLLPTLFIVSEVEAVYIDQEDEVRVEVGKARGKKCSRCWNYRASVGESQDHPEICDRCIEVVSVLSI